MTQAIVYMQDNGVLAIIHPVAEAVAEYGIRAVALKDVPHGKKFKIVDVADLPTDRSQRNLWVVDESELDDGVGAESNEFPSEDNK